MTAWRMMWLAVLASGCCSLGLGTLQPRSQSEYQEHAAKLSRTAPAGFTVIAVPPFVVLGDGRPEDVHADAESVVGWAVRKLKADYFPRDPARIVDIWMFSSEESYRSNNSAIFGNTPISPYGYYSPCDRAIIVNASLGSGTLVHEMVHTFMEANFPGAPTWFNEGLASLYEQPDDNNGHIHGRTNWRLAGLQHAIELGKAPRIAAVLSTSRGEFYDQKRSGSYYAAARYLLHMLQERGALVDYYHRFLKRVGADPSGADTLLRVLGRPDMDAVQREWETYVMALRYP